MGGPGRLGIAYDFANGDGEACPISPDDWPVIKKLERKGALSYIGNAARELALEEGYVWLMGWSPGRPVHVRFGQKQTCVSAPAAARGRAAG